MFRSSFITGARSLTMALLVCLSFNLHSQPLSAEETVSNYSSAQKRLLVLSTAQFINRISQDNLDRDTVVLIACKVTGLPFLIPYSDDDSGSPSPGADLINAGKIPEANQLLKGLDGDKRLQLLIELATWYLHKAGTQKKDLDSANHFIQDGLSLSSTVRNKNKRFECLSLLGEYYRQIGQERESKKIFLQIITSSLQDGNKKIRAGAWQHLGRLDAQIDSLDLTYLNNSAELYHELQLREKEIEVLWEIAAYHKRSDISLWGHDLLRISDIQQSIGFRHSLFAEYNLSMASMPQAKYLETLERANAALENMKWSGMSALEATFYMRIGAAYSLLGKSTEALDWFTKGLENRSDETHIFWFKSLLFATTLLYDTNRPEESLSLMQSIINEFPPATPWEKAQVFSVKGVCYGTLNNYKLANENFMSFLEVTNKYPDLDRYGELDGTYSEIARFYLSKSNLSAARLFVKKASLTNSIYMGNNAEKNLLLFKIDSIAGDYKSAMNYHVQYKIFDDSSKSMEQRKKFDELTIKYGAEKKDQDIKLLEQEKILQGTMLVQAKYTRNWILGAVALLLIIVGLLMYNTRLKQRTNKKLETQQRAIEEQNLTLHHLVNEKDWLVKEIHHRVKNNLQTVMGLLGTQSGYLRNDEAINAITDSQRRIQAMSLIHQRLYQSNNLSAIKMTDYIHELVDSLSDSFNISNPIRFNLEIEPIELDLTHCIPLGLILNEAITNSFKYAFQNDPQGVISISLKNTTENNFLLTIKDNGPGLPSGFNVARSDSMGINLMRGLSAEIGAQFILSSDNGVQVELSFMYDPDITIGIVQSKTETAYSM